MLQTVDAVFDGAVLRPDVPLALQANTRVRVTVETDAAPPMTQTEFQSLVDSWRWDTGAYSGIAQKAMHPAYQRIIGRGREAIPWILAEMMSEPDHWFWALRAITGEDPVPTDHLGDVPAMTRDWLEWGKLHHFIDNS